jgi:2,4-dienoyl-CoA reductase-like NADH-dependent reductase (Old Yellow Enzyme family)
MLNVISTARPQPLFTPVKMGELQLPNRIIMAPLTGMRAANPGHVPTEYYAQRASAGLIIGECTEISPDAYGWADTPRPERDAYDAERRRLRESSPSARTRCGAG